MWKIFECREYYFKRGKLKGLQILRSHGQQQIFSEQFHYSQPSSWTSTTHHTFIIYSGIDICTSSIYIHFNQCNAFATQIVGLNGYTSAELRLGMSRNTHICSLFQLHTINSEDMSVLIVPDELMRSCLLQSAKMGPCGKFSTKFSLTPDISSIVNGKWWLLRMVCWNQ